MAPLERSATTVAVHLSMREGGVVSLVRRANQRQNVSGTDILFSNGTETFAPIPNLILHSVHGRRSPILWKQWQRCDQSRSRLVES